MDHIKEANLNLSSRNWDVIHDFTPMESETNWDFTDSCASDYVREPFSNELLSKLLQWEQKWLRLEQNTEYNVIEPKLLMETTI